MILDIGPGCSDIASYLIEFCEARNHTLILIDSSEMLSLLPDSSHLRKVPAHFPDCPDLLAELKNRVDVILCYSVFHYIFREVNIFEFLDKSLSLLAPKGQFLIGDIPNISMRKRFFSSESGIAFHKSFMNTDQPPKTVFNTIEPDSIDDSVIFSLLNRSRLSGFNAFVLPQPDSLPMSNRREDILIIKP